MPGKTHMISVRLTDAERRKLSQICAVSGLPVSAAIREMIGGVTIRQRPPQELHDLYVEINRIGNNINQIARKANADFATKEDVRELKFLMRTIEAKMTELVKQYWQSQRSLPAEAVWRRPLPMWSTVTRRRNRC